LLLGKYLPISKKEKVQIVAKSSLVTI